MHIWNFEELIKISYERLRIHTIQKSPEVPETYQIHKVAPASRVYKQ